MANEKITELTEDTSPTLDDLIITVDSPSGSPANKKVKISTLWSILNLPRGYLINGKIVPSVASNNLTVAIKGLDGNDPSATNPVYCRIGDTIRSITSALSVTCNAGANWFNAGSTELATKEIDYFIYLGYNATDGVVIGFARIPSAGEYSDFSTTNTNEKYCAISTITNAAAGDDYEVIGRFAATLSAGAGYTWSVPTYTNDNLIQRPIYISRWLIWNPTIAGFSLNPANGLYYYWVNNGLVYINVRQPSDGTSNANNFTMTAPFTAKTLTNQVWGNFASAYDNGALVAHCVMGILTNSNLLYMFKSDASTGWTTSGNKRCSFSQIFYEY
jgi:hypothetical protein